MAKTAKMEIEMEVIRKTRIPIEIMSDAIDECFAETKAVIKRSKLSAKDKRAIFQALREVPKKLKW